MSTKTSKAPCIAVVSAGPGQHPPGLDALSGRAQVLHANSQPELERALASAEVLLVTDFRTSLVQEAWHAAEHIRWVHAASAGVDRLLFPELLRSEVVLTNARGVFDAAIAEYVMGAIHLFAKDFLTSVALRQRQEWRHRETERVGGKHLLVVGAGSIGGAIARRATALGMRVTGVARTARAQEGYERVVAQRELRAVLPDADYVVLAAPLTRETHHLFGHAELTAMRQGARLINIGRGPLIDTQALLWALQTGKLGGAALDVFEQEPLPPDHPLWRFDNVLLSAHMAGDFIGWRLSLTEQFVENFDRYVRGEPLHNVVDKRRHLSPPAQENPT